MGQKTKHKIRHLAKKYKNTHTTTHLANLDDPSLVDDGDAVGDILAGLAGLDRRPGRQFGLDLAQLGEDRPMVAGDVAQGRHGMEAIGPGTHGRIPGWRRHGRACRAGRARRGEHPTRS
jgi:hypothetical protein